MSFGTNRSTLTYRLTRAFGGMFFAVLLGLSLMVFLFSAWFLLGRQQSLLSSTAQLTADHILEEIHEGDALTARDMMEEQNTNTDMNLYLIDEGGQAVNQLINFRLDVPLPLSGQKNGSPLLRLSADHGMVLFFSLPIMDEEAFICDLYAVLNLETEVEFLKVLGLLLLGANLLGLFASLFAGYRTGQRMLRPIGAMIAHARTIGGTSLHERLEVPQAKDELQALALTLNGMLDRLQAAFEIQGRFVADASHELRTPLAILQGNADLLARWGREDEKVFADSIAAIQRQTGYMHKLGENLLFLARSDGGRQELSKSRFPAKALLEELLEEQTLVDSLHRYSLQCPETLLLYGDYAMLKQLLRALVDNSVKYTPEKGEIRFTGEILEGYSVLTVSDTGIGMKQEHLTHMFERFYRADKVRSRATGGMGLGLSIAAAIAEAHGGKLTARSAPGEGTSVSLYLPMED